MSSPPTPRRSIWVFEWECRRKRGKRIREGFKSIEIIFMLYAFYEVSLGENILVTAVSFCSVFGDCYKHPYIPMKTSFFFFAGRKRKEKRAHRTRFSEWEKEERVENFPSPCFPEGEICIKPLCRRVLPVLSLSTLLPSGAFPPWINPV